MKKILPIHPFPARMAPEIAFEECEKLSKDSVILDPMCGSGTTLRMAAENGIKAIGSDLDPLAVLISKVNTTYLDASEVLKAAGNIVNKAQALSLDKTHLPWIDNDEETQKFISFWFAEKQIEELRRILTVINKHYSSDLQDFLKIAVSRLIITKEMGASLARDTSHSRPHRVSLTNNFDVYKNFLKSVKILSSRIPQKPLIQTKVEINDARRLKDIKNNQIDAIITSPPYLNAIDYMRGNKLALVWLGYKISELRVIRGLNIGAEKGPDNNYKISQLESLIEKMDFYNELGSREKNMFSRYALDIFELMQEVKRVLKPNGSVTLVVGNSCLKGIFIKNTDAVIQASKLLNFEFVNNETRDLPANRRYLPIMANETENSLSKRMRTESILTFRKKSVGTLA